MASSSSEVDVIVITITNSDQSDSVGEETLVSDEEIPAWKFPSFLSFPKRLKILANRSRLVERSSYFHGMLNWSFRESGLDRVSIEWDVEAFVNILKCIHGCSIDINSKNFVSLYEGSLYFGVEVLLEKCKAWFLEAALSTGSPQIQLDDLICIWDFGFKHAKDFLTELCATYLARNFMWAISFKCFVDVPYKLLEYCLKHNHLTIESEMYMCDALFALLDAKSRDSEDLSGSENNCVEILKQIRLNLLPLDFTSGKRRSCYSKLANESIISVFRILNNLPNASTSFLDNHNSNAFRIRLSEFSKKMNLSSCPQITTEMMILSLLPHSTDSTLKSDCKELLIKLQSLDRNLFSDSLGTRPMLSFEPLEEVNISKCRGLDLQASIMCFSVSFPSLKRLKAAYLLNFNMETFHLLVSKCPVIQEVDLSLDVSPVILEQNTNNSLTFGDRPSIWKPMMSNITKLILQGRSELSDLDLLHISKICSNLRYLNVKGCTTLSDQGISTLISREVRLESILACHTSFGLLSVLALCSTSQPYSVTSDQLSECMAFNLKTLHIGSCKCLDETDLMKLISKTRMLKSLCLRDTRLTDQALHSFAGYSLEMLDITNTMVSGATIARVVYENPDLKCLRMKGCRNLCQRSSNAAAEVIYPLDYCGKQEIALGKTCKLEALSIGWGFSHLSMEILKPAITLLREITIGLGGSLGEAALIQLPTSSPNLEFIVIEFQVISDTIIINIMERLRNLRVLVLSYCFGDISISSFKLSIMPCLRKLELKRVVPWMSNKDLFVLTENCPNLVELSLLGCPNLNTDSQQIISRGWPGLVSLYLEECGEVTANGVSSLFNCVALEDLLLRHNGPGIESSFILDASCKLPLLRLVSLDLCDSTQGYFDVPSDDRACFLRLVKMAKCKLRECGLVLQCVEPRKRPVHKETLLLEWTGKNLMNKVVKERL